MTPRQRKPWSKVVEEMGIAVRVYERAAGSLLYREVRVEGGKDRKSLGHRDRALAEQQARELARRIAELRYAGKGAPVTLGQLWALYQQHRLPLVTPIRARTVHGYYGLLERHIGRDFLVENLTQHHVDQYAAARRAGALESPKKRGTRPGVRDGSIRSEVQLLLSILHFGQAHKVNGKALLASSPLVGVAIPQERNPLRPVATEDRYQKLLEVADSVEPLGRFRCVLALARETGRRINAIVNLRATDVLLSREQIEIALASVGAPVAWAEYWPHGALRWRKEHDKMGYESVTPLSALAREAIDVYLARNPKAGDVPLFPELRRPNDCASRDAAEHWLRRAEKKAGLPRLARGGYHAFRRLFASERRHLPDTDVMAAAGWRSLAVMRRSYQHTDGEGVYAAVERPSRVSEDSPGTQAAAKASSDNTLCSPHIPVKNMMCAFGVPGYMIHGTPAAGFSVIPVDFSVAPGMYTT
jgi:integrase